MSNSTYNDSYLITLNSIQLNISRYGNIIFFILGNIGSLLNLLVLSRRNYLRNSCSSYILATTLPNLLIINVVILTRILVTFGYGLLDQSTFLCKFVWYITHSMTLLARTYILLACIDRWAMTSDSVKLRAFARIKISKLVICLNAIFWSLVSIHIIIYEDNRTGRCTASTTSYTVFFNFYNTILPGLIIPILMILFSFLTIRNVRKRPQRNIPRIPTVTGHVNISNRKKLDDQLLFMILVQQIVYIVTTLPFALNSAYTALTVYWPKSSQGIAMENLLTSSTNTLVLTNFCVTFYIYVLTSDRFRKDLKRIIFSC